MSCEVRSSGDFVTDTDEPMLDFGQRRSEGGLLETLENSMGLWRFGVFEVDVRNLELRRNGLPVRIREQSFRVLVYLLEHAGDLVSREDLRRVLWPADTFVDFDHSLNTAMMKLRDALGALQMPRSTSKQFPSAAIGSLLR